jgi:hypothetical protein
MLVQLAILCHPPLQMSVLLPCILLNLGVRLSRIGNNFIMIVCVCIAGFAEEENCMIRGKFFCLWGEKRMRGLLVESQVYIFKYEKDMNQGMVMGAAVSRIPNKGTASDRSGPAGTEKRSLKIKPEKTCQYILSCARWFFK